MLQGLELLCWRARVRDESEVRPARRVVPLKYAFRDIYGEVPNLGLTREVLDGGGIDEGKLQAGSAHAEREDEEERRKDQDEDPVDIEEALLASPPCKIIRHADHGVETIQGRPEGELDEVLEGRFGHDSSHPRTKMIHFQDATAEFAAVVSAVRFIVVAS